MPPQKERIGRLARDVCVEQMKCNPPSGVFGGAAATTA